MFCLSFVHYLVVDSLIIVRKRIIVFYFDPRKKEKEKKRAKRQALRDAGVEGVFKFFNETGDTTHLI